MNQIERLANNPLIGYAVTLRPERFEVSEYSVGMLQAVMGNLLGMSVKEARPLYRLGRVMSFDVTPRGLPDPVLVYSPIGDLRPYWRIWSSVVRRGFVWSSRLTCARYDRAIRTFIASASKLEPQEKKFAIVEMLKFKNDVILNRRFWEWI